MAEEIKKSKHTETVINLKEYLIFLMKFYYFHSQIQMVKYSFIICLKQPKNLGEDIKKFLLFARGDEKNKIAPIGKEVIIKTKNKKTKFKLRCPRYLYTLKIDDEAKAAQKAAKEAKYGFGAADAKTGKKKVYRKKETEDERPAYKSPVKKTGRVHVVSKLPENK